MQTHRVSQPRFPADRAFVVQVAVAELGVPDVPLGRAEHVVSGKATRFASWAELVVFIEQVLAAGETESRTCKVRGRTGGQVNRVIGHF